MLVIANAVHYISRQQHIQHNNMDSNSKTAVCTKVKLSHRDILQKQVQYFLVLDGNNNTECSKLLNLNCHFIDHK